MNKIKMGKFLKELREKANLSMPGLADEFTKAYLTVTPVAISKWEKGTSIPEINNIKFLSEYYGVSIDEILNGQRSKTESFKDKYVLDNDQLFSAHLKDRTKLIDLTNSQRLLIKKNTKTLAKKYFSNKCSINEKEELKYLIHHYYQYNYDASEQYVLMMLNVIRDDYALSLNEKWFEFQKLISPLYGIGADIRDIEDENSTLPYFEEVAASFDGWEKDMLLTMIQVVDPVSYDRNTSSKLLEDYKKRFGIEYDVERITKNAIKALIKCGAYINRKYIGYGKGETVSVRLIDRVEELHDELKKPIEIPVIENDEITYYLAENTRKNRLFLKHRYDLIDPLVMLGYTVDEAANLVLKNGEMPDEVILKFAEKQGVDTNRDFKYVKADVFYEINFLNVYWKAFTNDENFKFVDDEAELNEITEEIKKGEKVVTNIKFHYIGGYDREERWSHMRKVNDRSSLSELYKGRQKKRTQELLSNIDSLSLKEIRNKYFQLGGNENE